MSTGWVRSEMSEDQLRQAVMPMIDSYLRVMRGAAHFKAGVRETIQDECEADFRARLDIFAGQHGFFGEDRVFLNEFVAITFDERAAATEPAKQEAVEVVAHQPPHLICCGLHRWWALVLAAALGILLVMS
ncbi:MAG: hypothetical protein WCJ64_16080 [Rhodospirillaceae bacterium]